MPAATDAGGVVNMQAMFGFENSAKAGITDTCSHTHTPTHSHAKSYAHTHAPKHEKASDNGNESGPM